MQIQRLRILQGISNVIDQFVLPFAKYPHRIIHRDLVEGVRDEHVIHLAQRDWEETKKFDSQDIRDTNITCFSMDEIEKKGVKNTTAEILDHIAARKIGGYWIHFDTDVLNDDINPAVDYRIPGGLQFEEAEYFVSNFLQKVNIIGMSVTIYNASLDKTGSIAAKITASLGRMFQSKPYME